MQPGLTHIIRRSLAYNRKGTLFLIIVVALLTAVITGSLMTGSSVRYSLRRTSLEKLGKTGIVISSTTRYFNPSVVSRFRIDTNEQCTGILEINGYCNKLSTGETALGVKIYAVGDDFFTFQGTEGVVTGNGEAVINEKLAAYLGLAAGDEIAIHFNPLSDLPADAPFAPEGNEGESLVLKVAGILDQSQSGNFSLGISQIIPMNVFVNLNALNYNSGQVKRINRLIISNESKRSESEVYNNLKALLKPDDIGLKIRSIPATGGHELISNRIFIDQLTINEIIEQIPSASPVITYMINDFRSGDKSSPYSFISALPSGLYEGIPAADKININRWLAEDLSVNEGDTLFLSWYSPDPLNHLAEVSGKFIVNKIIDLRGIWADSLLMPGFPGIAGKESCSEWDAGVEIDMKKIREKDEDYWNKHRGLPKAFINYNSGEKLWGNNFGPATSMRFPESMSEDQIRKNLEGTLDPYKSGFTISDLPQESLDAAGRSVDFSTLFLGLGFFLIVSAIILLILVIMEYYESKRQQLSTLFSLGFTDRWIKKYILSESAVVAVLGGFVGSILGWLFNLLIIKALNTVWQGSVQTDTISPGFNPGTVAAGFIVSEAIILTIMKRGSDHYMKKIKDPERRSISGPSPKNNFLWLLILSSATLIILTSIFFLRESATLLSFTGGVTLFASIIFLIRQYYLGLPGKGLKKIRKIRELSVSFYSFNPSMAVMPVLFIAAGLFAVVITGVNRMSINDTMLRRSGGTGGYLLWGESAIPVLEDLNSRKGKKEFGLNESGLIDLSFIQAFKSSGNDASCLNLNHITSPPLLGIDPGPFITKSSFSFASRLKGLKGSNPWESIKRGPVENTIFGIADQTVLQYGLKINPGDTLILRAESGQRVNIIIAAGLKSSVFQGYVLIGNENFRKYFPSVAGSQVFLVDGDRNQAEHYREVLGERMSNYGARFESAGDRLATFFVVTNAYLSVFTILGGLGLILGVAGLGFILLRNFNQRKREFGVMMAAGFSPGRIRGLVLRDQSMILLFGILTGLISAFVATMPSIRENHEIPWITILTMILLTATAGMIALFVSIRSVSSSSLISSIRKE